MRNYFETQLLLRVKVAVVHVPPIWTSFITVYIYSQHDSVTVLTSIGSETLYSNGPVFNLTL